MSKTKIITKIGAQRLCTKAGLQLHEPRYMCSINVKIGKKRKLIVERDQHGQLRYMVQG